MDDARGPNDSTSPAAVGATLPRPPGRRAGATAAWLFSLLGSGLLAFLVVGGIAFYGSLALTVASEKRWSALLVAITSAIVIVALALFSTTMRLGRRHGLGRWRLPLALTVFTLSVWFGILAFVTISLALAGY